MIKRWMVECRFANGNQRRFPGLTKQDAKTLVISGRKSGSYESCRMLKTGKPVD